ncbi:hypothetical protein [Candidatus Velamenicoccus archaeovorus]|nr:hypothetical protein [Candidatus Velamenicoccus archaeovorus]
MKKIKVARRGRKCKHPSCRITLSVYNHGCFCCMHQNKANIEADTK